MYSLPKKIEVTAEWDAEAKVWVATSKDVPGLVTEAETVELLHQKLSIMIPELLVANGPLAEEIRNIPLSLIAYSEQVISVGG